MFCLVSQAFATEIYLIDRVRILRGARFDFKVEFKDAIGELHACCKKNLAGPKCKEQHK